MNSKEHITIKLLKDKDRTMKRVREMTDHIREHTVKSNVRFLIRKHGGWKGVG